MYVHHIERLIYICNFIDLHFMFNLLNFLFLLMKIKTTFTTDTKRLDFLFLDDYNVIIKINCDFPKINDQENVNPFQLSKAQNYRFPSESNLDHKPS